MGTPRLATHVFLPRRVSPSPEARRLGSALHHPFGSSYGTSLRGLVPIVFPQHPDEHRSLRPVLGSDAVLVRSGPVDLRSWNPFDPPLPKRIRRLGWIKRWDVWRLVLEQASAGNAGVDPDVRAFAAWGLARADGRKRAVVSAATLMTGIVIAAVTRKRWILALAVIVVIRGEANRRRVLELLGQVQWTEKESIV